MSAIELIEIRIPQESSITEAVEKQLQGTVQPTLTPVMGKKTQINSHSHDSVTTPLSGKF